MCVLAHNQFTNLAPYCIDCIDTTTTSACRYVWMYMCISVWLVLRETTRK